MANTEFEKYFEIKKDIFKDATVFDNSYCPAEPIKRKEASEIMQKVADFMRLGVAENIFMAGKHGIGKTLYGKYLEKAIKKVAEKRNKPIKVEYRNCRDLRNELAEGIKDAKLGKETAQTSVETISTEGWDW